MCSVYVRGWSKILVSYDSNQIVHADWLTVWLTRWLDRSDWDIEGISYRIGYGLGDHGPIPVRQWIGLEFEISWRRKLWFRYWLFSDVRKISVIFIWSVLSFYSIYSVKTLCDCVLLLRSTFTLYSYAPLLHPPLRFTLTLYPNPLLLRFPLSNTSYKSVIPETTTDSDITRSSERLRQETLKFTSQNLSTSVSSITGEIRIFYVLWVDSFRRPRLN